jgi:NDP-sugar pyrophosphorylase family protein
MGKRVQQIPILDGGNKVVGMHLWDDLTITKRIDSPMVVMAGGKGLRLRPETLNCPKPLLKIDNKPILEHIVERAKRSGITNFIFCINYLGHLIEDYFGDGKNFGINIAYVYESAPLGTAGALSLIGESLFPSKHIFVTNGDVLTDLAYDEMINFHAMHNSDATMAVKNYEMKNPYGEVKVSCLKIIGFEEKPTHVVKVNAGIYVIERALLRYIKKNQTCDMPTFFETISENGAQVNAFPVHESWIDIGSIADLSKVRSTHIKS